MEGQGMKDYTKLVKALRCCAGAHTKPTKCPDYDDSWCGGNCLDNHLIAAAAAIEALQADMKTYGDTAFKEGYEMGFAAGEARAEKRMEPKRGKWITDPHGVRWCSVCDSYYQDVGYGWNYCPNCGAKMTGEQDVE